MAVCASDARWATPVLLSDGKLLLILSVFKALNMPGILAIRAVKDVDALLNVVALLAGLCRLLVELRAIKAILTSYSRPANWA